MKIENLNDLFVHTLQDIYYAEKKIVKALPKMVKKTDSPELAKAFESHLTETEGQIQRLDQVFEMCGEKPKATKNPVFCCNLLAFAKPDILRFAQDDQCRCLRRSLFAGMTAAIRTLDKPMRLSQAGDYLFS